MWKKVNTMCDRYHKAYVEFMTTWDSYNKVWAFLQSDAQDPFYNTLLQVSALKS